jgi:NADPH:quinone reductase
LLSPETLQAAPFGHPMRLHEVHPAGCRHRYRDAPDGVDRIIDVALSANADLDAAVVRNGAVLAAYASLTDRPELPFWPLLFNNVTIRLLGSDDFPQAAKDAVARDLTDAAARSALSIPVAEVFPLQRIAAAHELIESGKARGRVLVSLPDA